MLESQDEAVEEYKREFFGKLNDALRKEGFAESQIAQIDTTVRRVLNL